MNIGGHLWAMERNCKEILDSKGTNVRQIAKATGISATTLYSIIQRILILDLILHFDWQMN